MTNMTSEESSFHHETTPTPYYTSGESRMAGDFGESADGLFSERSLFVLHHQNQTPLDCQAIHEAILELNLFRNDTFDEAMVRNSVEFIPLGLLTWIVCLIGIFCNLLSILVLIRPKMKSTYSILTLGLTLSDILYLLLKILRYGLLSLFDYVCVTNSYTNVIYPIIGPYIRALTFTGHTGSTYFTVALAIDRYISVSWPVKARCLYTKRRAYILVSLVVLFSITYNVPRWFEFHTEVATVYNSMLQENVTIYWMQLSALRKNPVYKSLYIFWGYFLVLFIFPFVALIFFNYTIFREVRRSNKARRKLTSYQQREMSFAMMLVSIVALFLITSTPYLVIDLLTYFNKTYPPFWDQLGNFLLTVNSAGNFIIYCAFGRKFRQEMVAMMKQSFRRGPPKGTLRTISTRVVPDLLPPAAHRHFQLHASASSSPLMYHRYYYHPQHRRRVSIY